MSEISREVLLANCRIRAGEAGGSGTVLYSAKSGDKYSTYILTNHHVVGRCIEVKKEWSPMLKRDVKRDFFSTVEVHFFKYQYSSRAIGTTSIDADIMTYDKNEDLALLKLRDEDKAPSVATLFPKSKEGDLRLGREVFVVGAALGEAPIITSGRLSQFSREIENREYWISTAPIIYGNSGGACYLEDTGELIGVPARVALAGSIFAASAVTHMGFIVPITRIYNFLDDQLFRFIYDSTFTEKGEADERDKRRKQEELKLQSSGNSEEEEEEETEDSS